MPKIVDPLTDTQIQNTLPSDKQVKLFDGGGLYLVVTPTGAKLWRFKYRFREKENLLSFGAYPEVTISDARKLKSDAEQLLAGGYDPSAVRRDAREKEKSLEASTSVAPSVRVLMGGGVEIWKDRAVVRLNKEETHFVCELLNKLM